MEAIQETTTISHQQFFDTLENDPKLLAETLDVILQLVISDPTLTTNVAERIKDDYPALSNAIAGKPDEAGDKDLPGCCQ